MVDQQGVVDLLDEIRSLLVDVACMFSEPEPLAVDVNATIVKIDRALEKLR